GGASSSGWYLAVRNTGEVVLMGAQPPSSTPWLVSAARLAPGRWHHIAATLDRTNGQGRIYVDGALDGSATFPGIAADDAASLVFAKASWANGYRLHAVLDEAVILPWIWSAADVAADRSAFSPPAPAANAAIAARWPFDSGFADASGNGFHPVQGGGQSVEGASGSARHIVQTSDVLRVPIDERLNPASFSVRVWVRLTQTPSTWTDLLSNYGADFRGWRLGITAAGKPFFAVASMPSSLPSIEAPTVLEVGRWTELIGVYDGAQRSMRLYVDGKSAAVRYGVDMTPRTEGAMTIGGPQWTASNAAHADLDEALVAPLALSAAEARADFAQFSPPAVTSKRPRFGPLRRPRLARAPYSRTPRAAATSSSPGRATARIPASRAPRTVSPDTRTRRRPAAWAFRQQPSPFPPGSVWDQYPSGWGPCLGTTMEPTRAGMRASIETAGSSSASPVRARNLGCLTQALTLGRWHHVAVSLDSATRRPDLSTVSRSRARDISRLVALIRRHRDPRKALWASAGLAFSLDGGKFYPTSPPSVSDPSRVPALAAVGPCAGQ
ncbi:MAG: LamG-like jellyroll fold domain-containing protein, partial [Bryobacterales bacterium]